MLPEKSWRYIQLIFQDVCYNAFAMSDAPGAACSNRATSAKYVMPELNLELRGFEVRLAADGDPGIVARARLATSSCLTACCPKSSGYRYCRTYADFGNLSSC